MAASAISGQYCQFQGCEQGTRRAWACGRCVCNALHGQPATFYYLALLALRARGVGSAGHSEPAWGLRDH
jgi:hypothetical protein